MERSARGRAHDVEGRRARRGGPALAGSSSGRRPQRGVVTDERLVADGRGEAARCAPRRAPADAGEAGRCELTTALPAHTHTQPRAAPPPRHHLLAYVECSPRPRAPGRRGPAGGPIAPRPDPVRRSQRPRIAANASRGDSASAGSPPTAWMRSPIATTPWRWSPLPHSRWATCRASAPTSSCGPRPTCALRASAMATRRELDASQHAQPRRRRADPGTGRAGQRRPGRPCSAYSMAALGVPPRLAGTEPDARRISSLEL